MNKATGKTPLDRQDARVRHDEGVSGALRGFFDRVRSGDLGSLPVVSASSSSGPCSRP